MKIDFRYANGESGNQSVLLRFTEGRGHSHTPCILIDSGENTDVSKILNQDEYLLGILLTHAHFDHFKSLPTNIQDGAKIYTSPDTASLLRNEFEHSSGNIVGDTSEAQRALEPIDDWKNLLSTLRIRPVPVGHSPGAAGFVIQFQEGEEWKSILATGDFTLTRTGGYPGISDELPLNIEGLIITGSTSPNNTLTQPLSKAINRAYSGSEVLLTATSQTGAQIAYILGHMAQDGRAPPRITITGHAAKVYDLLGYDVPNVTSYPVFENTDDLLERGQITISSPQVPSGGTAKKLFGLIKNNPGATHIQITNGGERDFEARCSCTQEEYMYRPHPDKKSVEDFIQAVSPIGVVITHLTESQAKYYRDKFKSYVWAGNQDEWFTLFDSTWKAPPWMTDTGIQHVKSRREIQSIETSSDQGIELTKPERGEVALANEAIDLSKFPPRNHSSVPSRTVKDATGGSEGKNIRIATNEASDTPSSENLSSTETQNGSQNSSVEARVVDGGEGLQMLVLKGEDSIEATHGETVTLKILDSDTENTLLSLSHGTTDDGT